jgi:hypothetical protein
MPYSLKSVQKAEIRRSCVKEAVKEAAHYTAGVEGSDEKMSESHHREHLNSIRTALPGLWIRTD